MFYALSWIFVLSLFAMWSLGAWAFHAATVWTLAQAGGISGAAWGDNALTLPSWLAPWVPPEAVQGAGQMLVGMGPLVDGLLQGAPALAGGVTTATWVIWAIGSVLLLLLGAGLHVLIALIRRSGPKGGPGGDAGASSSPARWHARGPHAS